VDQTFAGSGQLLSERLTRSWQHPGQFAQYPYPHYGTDTYPGTGSYAQAGTGSESFYSTTYLRLKDMTLRYNLPDAITTPLHLRNIQLYITGLNLVTWTAWLGADPEIAGESYLGEEQVTTTSGSLPAEREVTGGIRIKF
jgi:hypothetical protein